MRGLILSNEGMFSLISTHLIILRDKEERHGANEKGSRDESEEGEQGG